MASPQERPRDGNRERRYRPFVLPLLLIVFSLIYYFGELVDWAGWGALRADFFYGPHDVHRMLFLVPIVYAGFTAGARGAIIITLVSLLIFLPRAFFISTFPDPVLRMMIFVVIAGGIGVFVAKIRTQKGNAAK